MAFSDWKRIPPRKDSTKGDNGKGEEIGLYVPSESVVSACEGIKLKIESDSSSGLATFTNGSDTMDISGIATVNSKKGIPFSLRAGAGHSEEPQDITVKAICKKNNTTLAERKFVVCAHPTKFYLRDAGEVCNLTSISEPQCKALGRKVQWVWESDSGYLEDIGPNQGSPESDRTGYVGEYLANLKTRNSRLGGHTAYFGGEKGSYIWELQKDVHATTCYNFKRDINSIVTFNVEMKWKFTCRLCGEGSQSDRASWRDMSQGSIIGEMSYSGGDRYSYKSREKGNCIETSQCISTVKWDWSNDFNCITPR